MREGRKERERERETEVICSKKRVERQRECACVSNGQLG